MVFLPHHVHKKESTSRGLSSVCLVPQYRRSRFCGYVFIWDKAEHDVAAETEGWRTTLREEIVALHQKGEAYTILSLVSTFTENKTRPWDPLLLWVQPQPCCLSALAAHVRAANISALVSVGCGTGLLEWLIQAITGLSVVGYEVNASWWTSKYAPPTFIPLTFVDQEAPPPKVPHTHALMCCYFNNAKVFRQYVSAYEGPVLLIIGATSGDRHTDPHPLDYVDRDTWRLTLTHRISTHDLLAGYHRQTR
ncbi:uncharacterized protein LOC123505178 [Portunus trituberculatus]|uniref:uncharacterized protein LOC123505178 n=1 Tax=Portunus trituberculatus TaxID=210409 RepID=UPI001E1CFD5B|nr:uncharacterized protein LOC123505178 [Portunus trituberculatus]